MEIRGGVRPEKAESHDITYLGVGSGAGEGVSLQWRRSWRRDGYRGEHPTNFWSWIISPESPLIGYAPLESQMKRWAKESPIEGWFLLLSRERQGFDVDRDAIGTLTGDHLKSRHPWISPRISWVLIRRRIADQLFRPAGADAGCETMCIKQGGKACLDILPNRRRFVSLSRSSRGRCGGRTGSARRNFAHVGPAGAPPGQASPGAGRKMRPCARSSRLTREATGRAGVRDDSAEAACRRA